MRRATLSDPPRFAVADRAPGRVTLRADTGAVAHLFPLEDDIVRVLLLPGGAVRSAPSWAVAPGAEDIAEPGRDRLDVAGFACPAFALDEADGILRLETARIRLELRLHGFHCTWHQRVGAGWAPMSADRPTQAYDFGWWDGRVHHHVARRPGERFYGLGECAGDADRSGRRFRLSNRDPMGYDAEHTDPLYKGIPYLLVASPDGTCHGAFYDNVADSVVDLGRELDNYHGAFRSFVAEAGELDLYMIAGPDPLAVTRRFTWLTGRPALMPRWSLGYSGSTMSYTDAPDAQARMADFVDGLERHDIGCTSFHLSSGYTSIGPKRYVFHWNRDKFPDPAAFVRSYAEAGIRLVANIKPALLRDHPRFPEAASAGHLVADAEGRPVEVQFWDEVGAYVDFTAPAAAAWWRASVGTALLDHGMAATWNDNNEYEVWDAQALFHGFGRPLPAAEARPVQPLLMARASRAAQLSHAPGARPYLVTRSGMAGLQRYAQTWTGDNRTDWKTIRFNARMAIGLALSGISNTGHDVGGFAGPKPDPELFLRWIQAGVLMPRFSIHSWNDDGTVNEPWMHPEALSAVRRLMALRQTLVPALHDLLWRHHLDFEPVLRPTWLDAPGDAAAWDECDEHMIGPDLLAAPVMEPGRATRRLRVPAGGDWIDVWGGGVFAGGGDAELPAPLDGPPPLLARAGSALLVDLARGGFRPGAHRPGFWLFPPAGAGRFAVRAYDGDGEGWGAPGVWRLACRSTAGEVAVAVEGAPAGAGEVALLLPPGEARRLVVSGGAAEVVTTPDGRRGAVLRL